MTSKKQSETETPKVAPKPEPDFSSPEFLNPEPSTELALLDEDAASAALADGAFSDDPDLSNDDFSYSRLSLLQPQSDKVNDPEANYKAGTFLVDGEVEATRNVTIIPRQMKITREYATGPREARVIHCSSNDAKTGHGDPGGSCRACPMTQWIPDPDRPGKKLLRCQPTYHYVVYDTGTQQPVALSLSKTGTDAAKAINGRIMTHKLGKFAVQLSTVKGKGDGNYFVPVARFPKPEPEHLADAALAIPAVSTAA